MPERALEDTTPFQRLTLLAVVDLASRGESPVHSFDVREACDSHADALGDVPFGGTSRQEVIAALNGLADAGWLTEEEVRSPVGKFRPAYALAEDPTTVLAALDDDGQVGGVVARLRERSD